MEGRILRSSAVNTAFGRFTTAGLVASSPAPAPAPAPFAPAPELLVLTSRAGLKWKPSIQCPVARMNSFSVAGRSWEALDVISPNSCRNTALYLHSVAVSAFGCDTTPHNNTPRTHSTARATLQGTASPTQLDGRLPGLGFPLHTKKHPR